MLTSNWVLSRISCLLLSEKAKQNCPEMKGGVSPRLRVRPSRKKAASKQQDHEGQKTGAEPENGPAKSAPQRPAASKKAAASSQPT